MQPTEQAAPRITEEAMQKADDAVSLIGAGAYRVLQAWSWRKPVHEKRLNALALGAYEGLRPHPETRKPVPFSEVCTQEMRIAVAEGIRLLVRTNVLRYKGKLLLLAAGVTVRGTKLEAVLTRVLQELRVRVAMKIQQRSDAVARARMCGFIAGRKQDMGEVTFATEEESTAYQVEWQRAQDPTELPPPLVAMIAPTQAEAAGP